MFLDKYETNLAKIRVLKNDIRLDQTQNLKNLKEMPTVYTVFSKAKTQTNGHNNVQGKLESLFGLNPLTLRDIKQSPTPKTPSSFEKEKTIIPKQKNSKKIQLVRKPFPKRNLPTYTPEKDKISINKSLEKDKEKQDINNKPDNKLNYNELPSNLGQLEIATKFIKVNGYTDNGIIINTKFYPIDSQLDSLPIYFYTKKGIIKDFATVEKNGNIFYLSYNDEKQPIKF
jgi:hypothetical protein